jgi:hypothetical protein
MGNGKFYTVPAAKHLRQIVTQSELQLFYDHGDTTDATAIVIWYGEQYKQLFRPKQLAQLDMVVIQRKSLHVVALIEIEDTTDNPKTLIGDLMTTLLGSGIAIGAQTHWAIGPWTTLMVFAHVDNPARQAAYQGRIDYLQAQIGQLLPHIETNNARIGRVILDSFVTQTELDAKLQRYLTEAMGGGS